MLFRLRGRFRVSVPSLSQCPSRAGCGVDRMLFRRGDGSFLPGACFDGGDRNECARRTTALFGRNESPTEPVGSVRRGGTPVVVGIEKRAPRIFEALFRKQNQVAVICRVQAYLDHWVVSPQPYFTVAGMKMLQERSTPAPALLLVNTSLEPVAVIEAPA